MKSINLFGAALLFLTGACNESSNSPLEASTSADQGSGRTGLAGSRRTSCLVVPSGATVMNTGLTLNEYEGALTLPKTATVVWEAASEDQTILRITNRDDLSGERFEIAYLLTPFDRAVPSPTCGPQAVLVTRVLVDETEAEVREIYSLVLNAIDTNKVQREVNPAVGVPPASSSATDLSEDANWSSYYREPVEGSYVNEWRATEPQVGPADTLTVWVRAEGKTRDFEGEVQMTCTTPPRFVWQSAQDFGRNVRADDVVPSELLATVSGACEEP